jgi:methylmalonyl-CoA mutase cobalamin-binding subunit
MVAAVSGDLHSLPSAMAAVALRADNWSVEHLGANMPPEELVRFCTEHPVDVAVVSSTNPETAALAAETAGRLRATGIGVVLGGPGRTLHDLIAETRAASRATTEPT